MSINNEQVTLQVQSVIYRNDKAALQKAVAALCNSFREDVSGRKLIRELTLYYGDSSPEQTFSDEEIQEIQDSLPENMFFQYRFFGFNSGTAKGHNLLAEKCECDYLIIMNPDVIMSPLTLDRMLEPFADPKVGMVEARQSPIEHIKEYNWQTGETEWATTACAAIDRNCFEMLNGFDSKTFFLYGDDLDFSWRLRLEGYKIIYQPLSPVYHAKRLDKDAKWMPTSAEVYYSLEASLLMAYKWSNNERVDFLLKTFQNGTYYQKKALNAFMRLKTEGKLPRQIDPDHKVSRFLGDFYTENRYSM